MFLSARPPANKRPTVSVAPNDRAALAVDAEDAHPAVLNRVDVGHAARLLGSRKARIAERNDTEDASRTGLARLGAALTSAGAPEPHHAVRDHRSVVQRPGRVSERGAAHRDGGNHTQHSES